MLRWDIRIQLRCGLYTIYAILVALFVVGLRYVPESYRSIATTLVIFGDPVFLGMYFIAALVLFEKGEGVLAALTGSPLRGPEYLVSKTLSLTILTMLASLVIALSGFGSGFRVGQFVLGVGLTAILFVFVGFIAVARFETLNSYFVSSLVFMLPFGIPLVTLLGFEHGLLYLIPTQASILLIGSAFGAIGHITPVALSYAVVYLLLWIVVAWMGAIRAFEREIAAGASVDYGVGSIGLPKRDRSRSGSRVGPIGMLLLSDLRNWVRDPLLLFVLLLPVFYGVVGRLVVPVATGWLAPGFDLAPHYPLLIAFFVFVPPLTIGFVVGLYVIEEKEDRILEALWTTPIAKRGYLLYRSVSAIFFSIVLMVMMVPLLGIAHVPASVLLPAAGVGSIWAVACALALPSFASNTIEGVAVSKFVGVSLMLPTFAIVIVPEPLQYLSGIVPLYWPLKALVVGAAGGPSESVLLLLFIGLVTQGIVVAYLVGRMRPY